MSLFYINYNMEKDYELIKLTFLSRFLFFIFLYFEHLVWNEKIKIFIKIDNETEEFLRNP